MSRAARYDGSYGYNDNRQARKEDSLRNYASRQELTPQGPLNISLELKRKFNPDDYPLNNGKFAVRKGSAQVNLA